MSTEYKQLHVTKKSNSCHHIVYVTTSTILGVLSIILACISVMVIVICGIYFVGLLDSYFIDYDVYKQQFSFIKFGTLFLYGVMDVCVIILMVCFVSLVCGGAYFCCRYIKDEAKH